jgi:hypothetical protein
MFTAVAGRDIARAFAIVAAVCASNGWAVAQTTPKITIRTLAPSVAVSKDSVGPVLAVRALSNGNVLVNDIFGRRVMWFDASLGNSRVVIDTIGGAGSSAPLKVPLTANTLIRYLGDSSLYVDRGGQSLLVLDANGKVARVMSIPRPSDFVMLGAGGEAGNPGLDSKGRIVYHGVYRRQPPQRDADRPWLPPIPVQLDSAPIVRADLDTRTIDTLSALKLNVGAPFNRLEVDNDGNVIMRMWVNLSGVDDQWAVLSDGTVAVLSVHDYHIDWTDPDGTHRSTPKMPFDWKALTDADKKRMIDSMRPELERRNSVAPRTMNTPSGPRSARQQFEFLPLDKMSDFEQPIQTGAVKADLDARLWILPRTSLSAKDGLLYDVINRKGEIVERVQFPKDYVLAGFAEHGALYVVHLNGGKGTLERTSVK